MTEFGFFNPYVPDYPNKPRDIRLVVDFETCADDDFFAVGVLVASYPDGAILEQFEASVFRDWRAFAPHQLKFWQEHANIKQRIDQNTLRMGGREADKRRALAHFIRNMHAKYPTLQVLADNPTLDMRLIDTLLISEGLPVISIRANGKYCQPTCTVSNRSLFLAMSGARHRDNDSIESFHKYVFSAFYTSEFAHHHHYEPPITAAAAAPMAAMATAPPHHRGGISKIVTRDIDRMHKFYGAGSQHVPIADCARIMAHYFQTMDLVRFYQRYLLKPQRLLSLRAQALFNVSPMVSIPSDAVVSNSIHNDDDDGDDDDASSGVGEYNDGIAAAVAATAPAVGNCCSGGEGSDDDPVSGGGVCSSNGNLLPTTAEAVTPPPSAAVVSDVVLPDAASSVATPPQPEISSSNNDRHVKSPPGIISRRRPSAAVPPMAAAPPPSSSLSLASYSDFMHMQQQNGAAASSAHKRVAKAAAAAGINNRFLKAKSPSSAVPKGGLSKVPETLRGIEVPCWASTGQGQGQGQTQRKKKQQASSSSPSSPPLGGAAPGGGRRQRRSKKKTVGTATSPIASAATCSFNQFAALSSSSL